MKMIGGAAATSPIKPALARKLRIGKFVAASHAIADSSGVGSSLASHVMTRSM